MAYYSVGDFAHGYILITINESLIKNRKHMLRK